MEIVEIEPASLAEENKLKLSQMSEEEIRKAQQEIFERFDVKTIEFLRNRAKLTENPSGNAEKKESEFKKRRKAEKETAEKATISTTENMSTEVKLDMPSTSVLVEEVVKNLEVIDPEKVLESEDIDPYTRLAMDPTQLDITNKCLRVIAPRQQQNLLKLFDNLKIQPTGAKDDQFLSTCRQHVDAIKLLYLEEFKVEENRSAIEFAEDVNPLSDGAWFLVPIRRVLDAVQMRKTGVTEDDIEIARLSLMWAMLLMYERQTMFITLSQPNDVFIRVAEVFLIGPELFKDDIISQCLSRLINEYLLKKGRQHLLRFRANKPISGLDSFMPFYEDLIKHFEEFSYGDENFSLILLIGAYMNSYVDDSLLSIGSLWVPDKNVMRQMTISTEKAKDLLDYIKEWRNTYIDEVEEIFYERYSQVLAMYAAAIRDEKVTRSRNPAVFVIASTELGEFIKRHTIESSKHPQRSADLAIMVEMIRRTVDGKISL
uniref:RNA polymerase II-associated protein 1 N-terminal domain-containing protein n=1 Tax=Acrobeloides nanus TaxID=290746 RepID=A0A914CWX4_9BILA